jgi:flagellar biosynthesis protein
VGKGTGELAERIIAIAREHGVHVHEDRELVALLSQLELNASIPPELYRAVAAVLAFVYRLNGAR